MYELKELTSSIRENVAELVRERNHYLKRLEQVEAFADTLGSAQRKRLIALLHR